MDYLPINYKIKKKYIIKKYVAKSDFSNIYLVEYNGKKYILKECFPEKLVIRIDRKKVYTEKNKKNFQLIKRFFKKESEILEKLNKFVNEVVKIKEKFLLNRTIYLVEEYFEGITLKEYILNNKILEKEKIEIFLKILNIVEKIHKNNIIHCDIKPSNILINKNKKIKIIDFGSSIIKNEKNKNYIKISKGYSPVEMYLINSKIDEKTDIYSLCALFYFMLNKIKPIESIKDNDFEKLYFLENIDEKLKKIIKKGLEKKLENRYQSVEEIKMELKIIINNNFIDK